MKKYDQISVPIPHELREILKQVAAEEGRTISNLARLWLARAARDRQQSLLKRKTPANAIA